MEADEIIERLAWFGYELSTILRFSLRSAGARIGLALLSWITFLDLIIEGYGLERLLEGAVYVGTFVWSCAQDWRVFGGIFGTPSGEHAEEGQIMRIAGDLFFTLGCWDWLRLGNGSEPKSPEKPDIFLIRIFGPIKWSFEAFMISLAYLALLRTWMNLALGVKVIVCAGIQHR